IVPAFTLKVKVPASAQTIGYCERAWPPRCRSGAIPDRVEHGLVLVEDFFVATNPDREFAACRTSRATAQTCIEHVQPLFGTRVIASQSRNTSPTTRLQRPIRLS